MHDTCNFSIAYFDLFYRTCTSGGPSSCMHSAETVLEGYTNRKKIEKKVQDACNDDCLELKSSTLSELTKLEEKASTILAKEEEQASKIVEALDDLSGKFSNINEAAQGVQDALDEIEDSELDEDTKKEVINSINEAATENPDDKNKIAKTVKTKLGIIQATKETIRKKTYNKVAAFKKQLIKVKDGIKKFGTTENLAKASGAASSALTAESCMLRIGLSVSLESSTRRFS